MSVCLGGPVWILVRKRPWVFVCVMGMRVVGTTFVSMLGWCQVLLALLRTSVSVCFDCVCVCVRPIVYAYKKRTMNLCVFLCRCVLWGSHL